MEAVITWSSHVFTGPYRLESDKRNLHGQQQPHNVEYRVAHKQPLRESAHNEQNKYM